MNIIASMAIIDNTINAIIPVTILPQFSMFADFRVQGMGDVTKFTVRPNTLYTVSKSAKGERTTLRQRHFSKDILVTPVEHEISIYENLYSVLAGRTDIADFMGWVLLSVQTEMYKDALNAFTTGIKAQGTPWKYTGAFALNQLVKICETIQAKNGGIKPIICGSASALLNVLPDASAGFRMNIDGSNAQIELVKTALGFPVIKLENAIDGDNNLLLATDELYIVVPAADKLVKGVMTAGLSNGNDGFMNADITKDFTFRKEWDFVYASAAKGGVYVISA